MSQLLLTNLIKLLMRIDSLWLAQR